jgi:rhodanese-related sulfurtransferase
MKRKFWMSVIAGVSILVETVFALSDEEYKIIQKVADEFLSNIPASSYHVFAEDLFKRIKSGDKNFIIVDVRMPKDKKYDQGHIPGAIYIGFREIAKPENLAKLPKDKDIIIYCDTGHEENKVLAVLRMLGYKAYALKWGMMSWKVLPPTGYTLEAITGSILNNYPVEK